MDGVCGYPLGALVPLVGNHGCTVVINEKSLQQPTVPERA